jgi:hypothetical protein
MSEQGGCVIMPKQASDLTGQRFGQLTAIKEAIKGGLE